VAGLIAPRGALVLEHVSETVPENVLAGVTEMVEVLPEVTPGNTEMFPLLVSVKLLLLVGAPQKPAHPDRSGAAAIRRRAQFPIFIAAPPRSYSPVILLMRRLQTIAFASGLLCALVVPLASSGTHRL
jgi:hypothetical protein